jgi:hypothetical protein
MRRTRREKRSLLGTAVKLGDVQRKSPLWRGLFLRRIRASNRQIVSHARRHFALFLSLGKQLFFGLVPETIHLAFRFARRLPKPITAIADFLLR